MQSCSVRRKGG